METILSTLIKERPLTMYGRTFYFLNGQLVSRPSRNKKRTRRDEAGNILPARTPAQVEASERFRDMRRFARVGRLLRQRVGAWQIAAAGTGQTGDNLFHSMNGKACEGCQVVDFAEFHFSVGTLSMPRELRVTREGWRVHLRWEDGRDQPVAAPTDRVMIGYIHDTLPDSPQVFEGVTATRVEGGCTITIDPAEGRDLHVYVFMAREDGTAYSADRYFFLPGEEGHEVCKVHKVYKVHQVSEPPRGALSTSAGAADRAVVPSDKLSAGTTDVVCFTGSALLQKRALLKAVRAPDRDFVPLNKAPAGSMNLINFTNFINLMNPPPPRGLTLWRSPDTPS